MRILNGLIFSATFCAGIPASAQSVELQPGLWAFDQSIETTNSSSENVQTSDEVTECITAGNNTYGAQDLINEYFTGGGMSCSFVTVDIDQGHGTASFTCRNDDVGALIHGESVSDFSGTRYSVRTTGRLTSSTLRYDFQAEVIGRRIGEC
jgi:hypothetical protein